MLNKKKILLSLLIFIALLISFLWPKNYSINYKIDGYNIHEEYLKSSKEYYFTISNDKLNFDYYVKNKYLHHKKLITNITEFNESNTTCIEPKITSLKSIPLCNDGTNYIDYHLVNDKMKENILKYFDDANSDSSKIDNISIYNLLNKKYFLWQYNSFKFISNNKSQDIKLFNNDYYNIDLATMINNLLIIPNYDESYNFDELFIINLDTLKVNIWKINYSISYDSYVIGTYNKSIYLVDKKNKIEYEIVPHVKKIRIVATSNKDALIYDSRFKKINFNLLTQENIHFNYNYNTNYEVKDNKLYLISNNETLISSRFVNRIVKSNDFEVYYLSDDTLYYYNIYQGETKVMSNFEWNFNSENLIFPY